MTDAKLQPVGAEGYIADLRASLLQGFHSPDPLVRGAVREVVLELASAIRRERDAKEATS